MQSSTRYFNTSIRSLYLANICCVMKRSASHLRASCLQQLECRKRTDSRTCIQYGLRVIVLYTRIRFKKLSHNKLVQPRCVENSPISIFLVRQGKIVAVLNKQFVELYRSTSASNAAGRCSQIGIRGVQQIYNERQCMYLALSTIRTRRASDAQREHVRYKCIVNFLRLR